MSKSYSKAKQNDRVKVLLGAATVAFVLFVVLPTFLVFSETAIPFITAIVMIGFFAGLGNAIYRTFTD